MYPLIRVEEEVKKVFEDFSLSMRFFFRVIPRNSSYSAKKTGESMKHGLSLQCRDKALKNPTTATDIFCNKSV